MLAGAWALALVPSASRFYTPAPTPRETANSLGFVPRKRLNRPGIPANLAAHLYMSSAAPSNTTSLFRKLAIPALLVSACVLQPGCVRRRLTVRTNPPGAVVFVDDQEIGTTPCSASYVYYGTRKITVMKDGYRTETSYQKFSPPWYEIPPLDFISENFVPGEVRDERTIDVQLVPEEIVPQQQLIDRAQALRDGARANAVTPLTNLSPILNQPVREPELQLGVPGQGLPGREPLPYP